MNSATTYNVIARNRYNTVIRTFATEAAAVRFAAKLNRKNAGMVYGVAVAV